MQITAIEKVVTQENFEENENNEEEIMFNIKEKEDEGSKIMGLRFEAILHSLTASTKQNIEKRERLMELKKGLAKPRLTE